jgi:hypothetical protein
MMNKSSFGKSFMAIVVDLMRSRRDTCKGYRLRVLLPRRHFTVLKGAEHKESLRKLLVRHRVEVLGYGQGMEMAEEEEVGKKKGREV